MSRPNFAINNNSSSSSSSSIAKCQSLLYENYQENLNDTIDKLLASSYAVSFDGKCYNSETLVALINERGGGGGGGAAEDVVMVEDNGGDIGEFFLCSKMFNLIRLMHSIKHFKINCYEICGKKVCTHFLFYSVFFRGSSLSLKRYKKCF